MRFKLFSSFAKQALRLSSMSSKLHLPNGNSFPLPKSVEELLELLKTNCNEPVSLLDSYLHQHLTGPGRNRLINGLLPKIYSTADEVTTLFQPDLQLEFLPQNHPGTVTLSRSQVGSVLAHMFFCAMPLTHRKEFKGASDFRCWLMGSCHGKKDPRVAYLDSLFWYFEDLFQSPAATLQETVTFQRAQLAEEVNWTNCTTTVDPTLINLSHEGHIGDRPSEEVEVNFANRIVGFWTTATQEEILMGCSPEMCLSVLLFEPLLSNEVGLIYGAKKIAQHTGYGMELVCRPLTQSEQNSYDPNKRVVLCMDAEPIQSWGDAAIKEQLEWPLIKRELDKLFVGFSSCPADMPIATGKWGCGAFGGHAVIKGILQILAASVARRSLNFYIFGDVEMRKLLAEFLRIRSGAKVADVIAELISLAPYWSRKPPATKSESQLFQLVKEYEYTG